MHAQSIKRNSIIGKPRPNDFLFGRGVTISKHPGNMIFRKLITTSKSNYRGNTRDARKRLSYKIYAEMKGLDPPGRFLIRESVQTGWVEVDEDKAITKISQSLSDERRKTPSHKKKINPSASSKTQINKDTVEYSLSRVQKESTTSENISKSKINLVPNDKSSISNLMKKKTFKLIPHSNQGANHSVPPDRIITPHNSIFNDTKSPEKNDTLNCPSLCHNIVSKCNFASMSHLESSYKLIKESKKVENNVKPDLIPSGTHVLNNDQSYSTNFETTQLSRGKIEYNVLNSCIMPISYIGQSFLSNENENEAGEEETTAILRDLAELGNDEEYAGLYLPSIIGRLCKRIKDLESNSLKRKSRS